MPGYTTTAPSTHKERPHWHVVPCNLDVDTLGSARRGTSRRSSRGIPRIGCLHSPLNGRSCLDEFAECEQTCLQFPRTRRISIQVVSTKITKKDSGRSFQDFRSFRRDLRVNRLVVRLQPTPLPNQEYSTFDSGSNGLRIFLRIFSPIRR